MSPTLRQTRSFSKDAVLNIEKLRRLEANFIKLCEDLHISENQPFPASLSANYNRIGSNSPKRSAVSNSLSMSYKTRTKVVKQIVNL